jgi:uncharacterized protein
METSILENMTDNSSRNPNALIDETSPYLLQHAYNPVKWLAWNEETLNKAKTLDKPIIVSIGYSACHWCHVMEHESFENEEVAAMMNEHFICIKVDREERPDVDQLYMSAAQLITGGGGWPLNCFAFPDGRPFYAGTYFQKDKWLQLLETIHREWTENRVKLEDYANKLLRGIKESSTINKHDGFLSNKNNILDLIDQSVLKWSSDFDHKNGGVNRAPKFPLPNNYLFLLKWALETNNNPVSDYTHFTLKKMARGGIYDQIGGGFSRYAVDNVWKVPHFEKMLYDNAQLLSLYSEAYSNTPNTEYKKVIDQTSLFMINELKDKSGLFYSAYDADSEGVEGKYYVWTVDEFHTLFESDVELAKAYFGVNERGYWESENFILCRTDNQEILKAFNLTKEALNSKVESFTKTLVKHRSKRVLPGLDDKCLTSWNALAVSGFAAAYLATNTLQYKAQAIETLTCLLETQVRSDGRVWHSYKNRTSTIDGFLEDYATLIQAIIDVYHITFNVTYLQKADSLLAHTVDRFYSEEKMMFHFTSHASSDLVAKQVEYFDNVIPSSNSTMCRNLLKMSQYFMNVKYRSIALDMIDAVAPRVPQYGSGFSNWMIAMLEGFGSSKEVVVVGSDALSVVAELQSKAISNVLFAATTLDDELPIFEGRFVDGKTLIYVCQNNMCLEPVETVKQALKLLS